LTTQRLYSNGLEHVYDVMYKNFIDYKEKYIFYSQIIYKYQRTSVLEIGSETGNLGKFFINSPLNYTGLYVSEDMIKLSKSKNI